MYGDDVTHVISRVLNGMYTADLMVYACTVVLLAEGCNSTMSQLNVGGC